MPRAADDAAVPCRSWCCNCPCGWDAVCSRLNSADLSEMSGQPGCPQKASSLQVVFVHATHQPGFCVSSAPHPATCLRPSFGSPKNCFKMAGWKLLKHSPKHPKELTRSHNFVQFQNLTILPTKTLIHTIPLVGGNLSICSSQTFGQRLLPRQARSPAARFQETLRQKTAAEINGEKHQSLRTL